MEVGLTMDGKKVMLLNVVPHWVGNDLPLTRGKEESRFSKFFRKAGFI